MARIMTVSDTVDIDAGTATVLYSLISDPTRMRSMECGRIAERRR